MNSMTGLITANYDGGNFGALTSERPASSLPFGGRYRLIDFPLSNLSNSGITTVGIITPHHYRSLMDHIGAGKEWVNSRKLGGLYILPGSIYGIRNQKGHMMIRDLRINRQFLERSEGEHVVIIDSSMVCNLDLREVEKVHEESGNDATLIYKKGVFLKDAPVLYLDMDGDDVKGIHEGVNDQGSCYMDAMIINRDFLFRIIDWYEDIGYMEIMDALLEHNKEYKLRGYAFTGYMGPVYDLQSYLEVSQDLLRSEVREQLFPDDRPIYTKVQDGPPAKYATGCDVSASLISSGCIIEGRVENSVIFRDVHVAKGASVRNCVLMQHCEIGEGARLEHVICDKSVTISPGVQLSASYGSPLAITKHETI